MLDGEPKPQPTEGHATVLWLGTPLGRLRNESGGQVGEHDGGFGLIAVLSSRAGTPRPGLTAFGEQGIGVQGGGMHDAADRDLRTIVLGQRTTVAPQ